MLFLFILNYYIMKLRYLTVFVLLMSISFYSFSQLEETIDSRLLSKYSQEYLNKLKMDNPDEFDYLNFSVKNSYLIMDFTTNKVFDFQMLRKTDPITKQEIEVNTLDEIDENFNPFLYNCEIGQKNQMCYKVGNTGKMIVMRSKASLDMKYRSYKTQKEQINK